MDLLLPYIFINYFIDFVDEKYKGKGVYKYAEGDIFWGAYDHGQRNGYGECKYSSGDFYRGDFKVRLIVLSMLINLTPIITNDTFF